jgi:hypothetical protein
MLDQFVKKNVPTAPQETQEAADVIANDDEIMEAGVVDEVMRVDE